MNKISKSKANLSAKEKRTLLAQLLQEEVEKPKTFPLSFAQQRLWFLHQLEPNNPVYNVSIAMRLTGQLKVATLRQSLNQVIRRHEVLRTTFATTDEQPEQVISPALTLPMPLVNLQTLSESKRKAEAQRLTSQEVQRPFDLAKGPLIRAVLLQLGQEDHILLLAVHHIVFDGWSRGIFSQELFTLYEAFLTGEPTLWPELPIQYADFAHWQRQWLSGEVLETQLAYWKQQLVGAPPVLKLPTDQPRPPVQTFRGSTEHFQLNSDLVQKLKAQSQQSGVTLFITLLTAFATLLARYSSQKDIVIGSPIANRNRKEIEALIGFFINTLALRIDLSGEPTFRELLNRVRRIALGAYAHQDLPFEKLVDLLQPERNLSHTPLFQVMFVLQNTPTAVLKLPGLIVKSMEVKTETAKFDLRLSLKRKNESMAGSWQYSTDLFEAATITRMTRHFQTLLEGIVANPDARLSELPLLTKTEQHQLLVEWNDTQTDQPGVQCIHTLFEAQVKQTPDAIAVIFEDEQLTYQELNARANQLAHYLRSLGVGPEVLVGICVERSLETIVALFGVLKAGGAYVPLDPASPKERLAFMLEDAQVPLLLTQQKLVAALPKTCLELHSEVPSKPHRKPSSQAQAGGRDEQLDEGQSQRTQNPQVVCLDTDQGAMSQQSKENPANGVKPNNLAYALYTTGSTGRPKGVLVEHKQVVNYSISIQKRLELTPGASFAMLQPLTVDSCITVIFPSLFTGGILHLISRNQALNPHALGDYFQQHPIDCLKIAPSHLAALQSSAPAERFMPRRQLVIGGEASRWDWVRQLQSMAGSRQIFNHYGPTEATVGVLTYRVQEEQSAHNYTTTPLGRPILNTQIYLLDSCLQPVPIGVPGELFIGGANVARGYLNRPKLTGKNFIPDPFSDEPGARLYKTGDLARYLPDGNIEFLGRTDHQVKIRGFRIELGEIEMALGQHPAVQEVVVMVRDAKHTTGDRVASPWDNHLVAYFIPARKTAPTSDELRSFLEEKLPDYMIPPAFVRLKAFPRTAHGKLDRRALPAPDTKRPELKTTYVSPRNSVEQMLTGIWTNVLGLDHIGVHDNFFELGGHSLQAIQLVSKMSAALKRTLSVKDIFLHPTIASLADALKDPSLAGSETSSNKVYPKSVEHTHLAMPLQNSSLSPASLLKIEHRPLLSLFATGKISPVDSAALGYLRRTDFTHDEPVRNWFNNLPLYYRIVETSLGRTASIRLPRFDTELYTDEKSLVAVIIEALEMAKHIGARTVSLTGLIPSATNYGQAIALATADRQDLPKISTGHATTTATVILTIKRVLQESGRELAKERVGVLGLGSIGAASLRLMLKCLPQPSEIILCDLYSKSDVLARIKQEIVTDLGFTGTVRVVKSQTVPPPEFYEASLIVGATNVPDVLDIFSLKPGTMIIDDSGPHCFKPKQAIRRFEAQQDILFTEGGVLKSPHPISELRYVPKEAAQIPKLFELEAVLSRDLRHNPDTITGCVFSGLLSSHFEDLKPTVGLVDVETCFQNYERLNRLGFQGADLHCKNYTLDKETIHKFRRRFGK